MASVSYSSFFSLDSINNGIQVFVREVKGKDLIYKTCQVALGALFASELFPYVCFIPTITAALLMWGEKTGQSENFFLNRIVKPIDNYVGKAGVVVMITYSLGLMALGIIGVLGLGAGAFFLSKDCSDWLSPRENSSCPHCHGFGREQINHQVSLENLEGEDSEDDSQLITEELAESPENGEVRVNIENLDDPWELQELQKGQEVLLTEDQSLGVDQDKFLGTSVKALSPTPKRNRNFSLDLRSLQEDLKKTRILYVDQSDCMEGWESRKLQKQRSLSVIKKDSKEDF